MPDVRIYPPSLPRATGIARTSSQVANPNGTAGPSTHVTSSAGAGEAGHAHVLAARRATLGGPITKLDAGDVAVAASARMVAPAPSDAAGQPTVQLLPHPSTSATAIAPLSPEQLSLLAMLADTYRENTMAIGDVANQALAEGTLAALARLASGSPSNLFTGDSLPPSQG